MPELNKYLIDTIIAEADFGELTFVDSSGTEYSENTSRTALFFDNTPNDSLKINLSITLSENDGLSINCDAINNIDELEYALNKAPS